jgi:CheY-like chemotaxis protein
MNVFILDEDWEVEVLVRVLQSRHPADSFVLADNLRDGRRKLWSEKFDVVVLDVMIPSDEEAVPGSSQKSGLLSGLVLHDLLRTDPACANREAPIIILTGLLPSESPRLVSAKAAMGGKFIQKPVHPDKLYNAILGAFNATQGIS